MLDLLGGFIQELRTAGLPVSLTENLDAMEAVKHIPIEDREAFKYALAATLVKNNSHWRAFETVFEVYFSLRGSQYKIDDETDADEFWRQMQEQMQEGNGKGPGGTMDNLTPEELALMLYQALMNGDEAIMRALARQAVSRFNALKSGVHRRATASPARTPPRSRPSSARMTLWGWTSWLPFSPSPPAPPHQPMLTTSG